MAQRGVFRWKTSASLAGQEAFIKSLLDSASPEKRKAALLHAAKFAHTEAKRLVPRDTGELQSEIAIMEVGEDRVGVGVPANSPAIEKAWATEYGTWNYSVGLPAAPKTEWPAKSKATAAMPWLRTALLVAKPRILRAIRRDLLTGKRPRKF